MSEYLSKEEIKQWRSSLEKITLEEFAARLGKKIEQKKETNDLVDIVLHGQPVVSGEMKWNSQTERLSSIATRAYEKEKELYISSFSVKNLKTQSKSEEKPASKKEVLKQSARKSAVKSKESKVLEEAKKSITTNAETTNDEVRDRVRIVFKKALTPREQKVFDYFNANQNKVVYAKDLAALLDLPRDYVYKYIKNLRAKIDGEKLQNADKGGFILNVK